MLIPSQETIKSLGEWHQYSVSEIALVLVICRDLHICKLFVFAVKVDKYLISYFKHAIKFEMNQTYFKVFMMIQRISIKMYWLYDDTSNIRLGDTMTTNQFVATEIGPNVNN